MKKKKKNNNCLEGIRCPHCKSLAPFKISCSIIVEVTDEGEGDSVPGSLDWDNDSWIQCHVCDWDGTIKEFTV